MSRQVEENRVETQKCQTYQHCQNYQLSVITEKLE